MSTQRNLFDHAGVVLLSEYRERRRADRAARADRWPDWAPRPRRMLSVGQIQHRQRMLRHLAEAAHQR